jgi:hypothetical protein
MKKDLNYKVVDLVERYNLHIRNLHLTSYNKDIIFLRRQALYAINMILKFNIIFKRLNEFK